MVREVLWDARLSDDPHVEASHFDDGQTVCHLVSIGPKGVARIVPTLSLILTPALAEELYDGLAHLLRKGGASR